MLVLISASSLLVLMASHNLVVGLLTTSTSVRMSLFCPSFGVASAYPKTVLYERFELEVTIFWTLAQNLGTSRSKPGIVRGLKHLS